MSVDQSSWKLSLTMNMVPWPFVVSAAFRGLLNLRTLSQQFFTASHLNWARKVTPLVHTSEPLNSKAWATRSTDTTKAAVLEWLGTGADQAPELDPMLRPPIKAETIFIQGDSDERVPLDITENYIKAMAGHGKKIELHILPNTSHFEMMNVPSATFTAILQSIN